MPPRPPPPIIRGSVWPSVVESGFVEVRVSVEGPRKELRRTTADLNEEGSR